MTKDLKKQKNHKLVILDFDGTIMETKDSKTPQFCPFNEKLIEMLSPYADDPDAEFIIITSGSNSTLVHEFLSNLLDNDNLANRSLREYFKDDQGKIDQYKKTAGKLLEILDVCDHYVNARKGFGPEEFEEYFGQKGGKDCALWEEKDPLLAISKQYREGSEMELSEGYNELSKTIENSTLQISVVGNDLSDQLLTLRLQEMFPNAEFILVDGSIKGFEGADKIANKALPQAKPLKSLKKFLEEKQPNTGIQTKEVTVSGLEERQEGKANA